MAVAARSLELPRSAPRLTVQVARDAAEIETSLALRHRVFVEEMGAHIPNQAPDIETDAFDRHCPTCWYGTPPRAGCWPRPDCWMTPAPPRNFPGPGESVNI